MMILPLSLEPMVRCLRHVEKNDHKVSHLTQNARADEKDRQRNGATGQGPCKL